MIDTNDPMLRWEMADRTERPAGWGGTYPVTRPWWARLAGLVAR